MDLLRHCEIDCPRCGAPGGLPCNAASEGTSQAEDHRERLVGETIHLRNQLRGAVEALREWLRFDGEVEPPHHDAPYEDHLAYETRKFEITEAAAAAIGGSR